MPRIHRRNNDWIIRVWLEFNNSRKKASNRNDSRRNIERNAVNRVFAKITRNELIRSAPINYLPIIVIGRL